MSQNKPFSKTDFERFMVTKGMSDKCPMCGKADWWT